MISRVLTGAVLRISLPGDKIKGRPELADKHTATLAGSRMELAKLGWKLSPAQTLVFGRFGRTPLNPLYKKLRHLQRRELLPADVPDILAWWADSIRVARLRQGSLKSHLPEVVIYTDAASSNAIIAEIIDVEGFS